LKTHSYIRTGGEREWATWEINREERRGEGSVEMGQQVASQRQGYRDSIDPIALRLSCRACFHDLLRQKPTSLFILLGWSSLFIVTTVKTSNHTRMSPSPTT
jgi:hypothetical protein